MCKDTGLGADMFLFELIGAYWSSPLTISSPAPAVQPTNNRFNTNRVPNYAIQPQTGLDTVI